MLKTPFFIKLENSTAHRHSRDEIMQLALDSNENLKELVSIALNTEDKNHYKACWALELVLNKEIELILPFLDNLIETLPNYNHDGALRSMSKIMMFVAQHNLIKETSKIQKITDVCFVWLTLSPKVATKCYAAYALLKFSKYNQEIKPLLQEILEQDYTKYSPAYQATAREVIKKLAK